SLIAAPWTAGRLSRQGDRFSSALTVLCLIASLAVIWSVARIQGEMLDQLMFWITIVGLFTLTCLVAAAIGLLVSRLAMPRLATLALAVVVVIFSTGNGESHLYAVHEQSLKEPVAERVQAATASLRMYLEEQDLHAPLIRIAQPTWGDAAGIVLALQRSGLPIAVEPKWIFMYGTPLAATGSEDCEIVFADAKRRVEIEQDKRFS